MYCSSLLKQLSSPSSAMDGLQLYQIHLENHLIHGGKKKFYVIWLKVFPVSSWYCTEPVEDEHGTIYRNKKKKKKETKICMLDEYVPNDFEMVFFFHCVCAKKSFNYKRGIYVVSMHFCGACQIGFAMGKI